MRNLHYNLVFRPEPEGGFTVIVPSFPGCVIYGETLKEAKEMALDAIKGYIASLKKHDEYIPDDSENFIASIDLRKKIPITIKSNYAKANSLKP